MISMQKLNKILVKKPVIAGEFIFLAIAGYFLLGSSGNDKPKTAAPKHNVVSQKTDTANDVKQLPMADFTRNPFGDISEFEGEPGSGGYTGGQLSRIPAIPHGNIPIPSLPGGIPIPGEIGQVSVKVAPRVSGILTSTDGGNMAIMSDGRVVAAGDSVDSKKIAYIGGDGISFDNGDFWAYGDAR